MKALRIVVCDDDINVRAYMAAMLKAMGVGTVIEAESVDSMMDVLDKQFPISGVFQDLVLQKGSGLEVGRECKSRGIPVVFCSASNDEFNVNQMLEIGWVLTKPVRLSGLQRAIEQFLCHAQRCRRTDCDVRT